MKNVYIFINSLLLSTIAFTASANSLIITNTTATPVEAEIKYTVPGFCRTDTQHLEPQQTLSLNTGACFVEQIRASSFYSRIQQVSFRPINGANVNISIFLAAPNQFGIVERR